MKFTKRMSSSINPKDFIKFTDFFGTHIGEVVSRETFNKEIRIDILVLHSTCKPEFVRTFNNPNQDFTLLYPKVKQGEIYTKFFRRSTKIDTNW